MTSEPNNGDNVSVNGVIDLHADFPLNFHENRGRLKNVTWPVLYTRHSMTLMGICLTFLWYYGLQEGGEHSVNVSMGIKATLGMYICLGMMVFPSGPFIRPHPVFWRLVFTLSTVYLFACVLFLFHTPDQMRTMLTWLDPKLGVPLPNKSYAEDCNLTYEAFSDKFDIFILAHAMGWFVKALVMRDRVLCWIVSIAWEFVEITTAYFIPNFAECWWDQWILDVLLCNGIGIECGLLFLNWFETDCPQYKWVPFMSIDGLCAKFVRARQQLSPINFESFHWEETNIMYRFLFYNGIIFWGSIVDMNLFLLKLWLWIPTDHAILMFRTFVFGGVMIVAGRQSYFFMTDDKCDFLGTQTWVCLMTLAVEFMIAVKVAPDIPPMPAEAFFIILACFSTWAVISLIVLRRWSHTKEEKQKDE